MKKIIIWILVGVVLVGAIYFVFFHNGEQAEFTSEKVSRSDIFQTVSVTGEIISAEEKKLAFEVGGTIKQMNVSVGEVVKEGQLIARVDDSVQSGQYRQALEDERIQSENVDLARRDWSDLRPEEREIKKAMEKKAREAAKTAGFLVSKTIMKSPMDGLVVKKNFEFGEVVSAMTPVVTIIKDGEFLIESNVPESDISKIKIGQKADVQFDAFSSENIHHAEVIEIEPSSTVIQDVVYYKIKLKLLDRVDGIKHGMSVDVDIRTDERRGVLAIPSRSIKTENDNKFVEILKDENTTEKKSVFVGLRGDDGMTEIISGISEGENVVTFSSAK